MNPRRRTEVDERLKEIKGELAAIHETRVIPVIDLPNREDHLLDELDALEFELGINHFPVS